MCLSELDSKSYYSSPAKAVRLRAEKQLYGWKIFQVDFSFGTGSGYRIKFPANTPLRSLRSSRKIWPQEKWIKDPLPHKTIVYKAIHTTRATTYKRYKAGFHIYLDKPSKGKGRYLDKVMRRVKFKAKDIVATGYQQDNGPRMVVVVRRMYITRSKSLK